MTNNPSGQSVNIVELIERLKDGVNDTVTYNTGEFQDNEYKSTRKHIMGHPVLRTLIPEWLRKAISLQDLRLYFQSLADNYKGRRRIVADGLNPMLDVLQNNEIVANRDLERCERLGGGGFGEVYRYHDNLLNMDFAVKILNPSPFAGSDIQTTDRFFKESRILFQLNHQNIVRIYDVGLMVDEHRPFIKMEFIEGNTLAVTGSLAEKDANSRALKIAHALAHAHDIRVVHRDVKPSNIMVSSNDRIVLLDFGLGAFVEGDIVSRITKTGEAAAGGLYTAPELEADPKLLDPKSDIYSLGAVWFKMLCGQAPAGTKVETTLRAVPSISDCTVELVLQCLAPIADRPTANGLIREFNRFTISQ